MREKEHKEQQKTKAWKTIARVIVFLVILVFIVLGIQRILDISFSKRYEVWNDYYDEPKGSLDAVYIGASSVYNFWIAPACWKEYGYTVFPLALPSMHIDFVPYVIEEARKTNPDVLYIVCLNSLKSAEKMDVSRLHNTADYMHLSGTKTAMINAMTEQMDITGLDRMEFYMPLIRFHSRWAELKAEDFDLAPDTVKAASVHRQFLSKRINVSKEYVTTEKKEALNEKQEASLNKLLDYCDETDANVLFVINPQPLKEERVAAQFNTITEMVENRGYHVLNMLDKTEEMGMCTVTDFYDYLHTNVHGAMKYTRYFSNYLKNTYGFQDKRGMAGYESWDNAVVNYKDVIDGYLLDFEKEDAERYGTDPVKIKSLETSQNTITVSWKTVKDADQYALYRKQGEGEWELLSQLSAETHTYTDTGTEAGCTYRYAAVPVKIGVNGRCCGNFVISKTITV